ncbi:MAG: SpoIIE family protein phosphatase [Flavobacteriales bacterium]|nr:SpoIIE family protein phosphatase [Flavobacteriales bacterium]
MPEKVNKILSKLELNEFKLNSLLEITKGINNNFSIDKLLKIYEYILREQLGISRLILYNFNQTNWNCLLRYGAKGNARKININDDLLHIKEITVIESSSSVSLNSFDIVIPIFHKKKPLSYLLIGDLNEDAIRISPTIKHMPFIQTLTNIIIVAIENKRFANESINQERTNKELEVASEMQRLLFPAHLPSNNRVDVAARYETQQLVGGDYYDFIKINNQEYVFCIADVSGKGISAAMLMSNFQANLKANVKYNHGNLTLVDLVHVLNEDVNNAAQGEKFITFFIGYYNCTERKLKYVNAGHNYPILTDGENFKLLNKGCIGLGMFDKLPTIEMEEVTIKPNDVLICYTDGLVELENEEGEQFETIRLHEIIKNNFHLSMKDLDKIIFHELDRFKGEEAFLDDTALLSCRFF